MVSASRPPNQADGRYSEASSTAKAQLLTMAVVSDARPSCIVACAMAASVSAPAATSRR